MHPLVSKFLSPQAALDVLDRRAREESLDPDESAFLGAAERFPDYREALVASRGRKTAPPEVQQLLLVVAASAVTSTLEEDPRLGAATRAARLALGGQGATREEVDALLTTAVLEEALTSEDSPDIFEIDFFQETLESLAHLAEVNEARVTRLLDRVDPTAGTPRRAAAGMLLETAWGDGPQPITVEHLQDVRAALQELQGAPLKDALGGVEAMIAELAADGLVGPVRRERLEKALRLG
ncbi:MAG: hypothetical protein M3Y59_23090 [Myxococcota bacterium]|nr:hypothetical protein [Myxococcota bacterium]